VGHEPVCVAQKTHVVNGTLGYEAQLAMPCLIVKPAINIALIIAGMATGQS
jgi:hypothetical protein